MLLYDQQWAGVTTRDESIAIPANLLQVGSNVVHVAELIPAPNYIWVNSVTLDFPSSYAAQNNALQFQQTQDGTWNYTIPPGLLPKERAGV